MRTTPSLAVVAAAWLLAGCASFGEGVTRGLLTQSAGPAEDTRMCEVSGPAFAGILPMLEHQAGHPPLGEAGPERPILKVIMVHGVGTHVPGYSARLSANLAQPLGLSVVAPEAKGFPIETPAFPGETLGQLTVSRHTNPARDREMLFYELTWSPISQPAKDAIAFDSTAVFAHRRASLNNVFIPTPLSTDRRGPVEGAEGADAAGFVAEAVPGGAAGVEDVVVARPEAVREEALAQVEPDPLDRVQLGRVGRQEDRGEVGRARRAPWRCASRRGP